MHRRMADVHNVILPLFAVTTLGICASMVSRQIRGSRRVVEDLLGDITLAPSRIACFVASITKKNKHYPRLSFLSLLTSWLPSLLISPRVLMVGAFNCKAYSSSS